MSIQNLNKFNDFGMLETTDEPEFLNLSDDSEDLSENNTTEILSEDFDKIKKCKKISLDLLFACIPIEKIKHFKKIFFSICPPNQFYRLLQKVL